MRLSRDCPALSRLHGRGFPYAARHCRFRPLWRDVTPAVPLSEPTVTSQTPEQAAAELLTYMRKVAVEHPEVAPQAAGQLSQAYAKARLKSKTARDGVHRYAARQEAAFDHLMRDLWMAVHHERSTGDG